VWWLVRVAGVHGRAGGGCGLCGILSLVGSNVLGMLAGYSCGWAACAGPCEMGCAVSLARGMRVVSSVPFLAGTDPGQQWLGDGLGQSQGSYCAACYEGAQPDWGACLWSGRASVQSGWVFRGASRLGWWMLLQVVHLAQWYPWLQLAGVALAACFS
jgi:hypothetical protein